MLQARDLPKAAGSTRCPATEGMGGECLDARLTTTTSGRSVAGRSWHLRHRPMAFGAGMSLRGFTEREGRAVSGWHSRGKPSVLLVDGTGCREFDALRTVLVDAFDVPVIRIAQDDLAGKRVPPECNAMAIVQEHLTQPTVAWLRHTSPAALSAIVARGVPESSLRAATCFRLLRQLSEAAVTALPGSEPSPAKQLSDAARLGVRVPRTIFTSDVAAAAARLRSPRVVVKAPGPRWVEPTPGSGHAGPPEVLNHGDAWPPWAGDAAELAVQEYVDHSRELRVYYLQGALCAFEVDKPSPASIWTEPDRVTVTPVACPRELSIVVRLLSRHWALEYGAFDLLVTPDGDPVFLEVNVDGDWLYFEDRATWSGVTFMAAAMVYEQHVRATW